MRRFHLELDDASDIALRELFKRAIAAMPADTKVRAPSEASLIRAAIIAAAAKVKP